MRLAEAMRRLRALQDTVERLRARYKRVQEAIHHAKAVGVWTDCVQQAFERELAAINRQLMDTTQQLQRLGEVDVDTGALERAYRGRRP